MTRFRFAVVSLSLVTVSGCQEPPASQTEEIVSQTRPTVELDLWTRSLQCADHAEQFGTKLQQQNAGNSQGAFQVIDWTNHYNRRESRCFVEVRYTHGNDLIAKNSAPPFSSELYDAVWCD